MFFSSLIVAIKLFESDLHMYKIARMKVYNLCSFLSWVKPRNLNNLSHSTLNWVHISICSTSIHVRKGLTADTKNHFPQFHLNKYFYRYLMCQIEILHFPLLLYYDHNFTQIYDDARVSMRKRWHKNEKAY